MKLMNRIRRALQGHRAVAPATRGISDVDPTPLAGMGEAVDPEAIARAHEELPDLRERLPRPGKNLP